MSVLHTLERALLNCMSPGGRHARLMIFTYHRVPRDLDPLLADEPDARAFAEQMDIIAAYCRVLPLPEAVRRLQNGTLPSRAVCITFDDGYENNLSVALPILEARGMTATIFVTADAVDRGIMWNDLLIEAVRRSGTDRAYAKFGLDPDARLDGSQPDRVMRVVRHLRYEPLASRFDRAFAYYRSVAPDEPPRLMLTREQVRQISLRGHDVGAHTVHHPILKGLSAAEAQGEIAGSFAWVTDVTGRPPRSFAYPNGWPGRDFDDTHAVAARDAGFELAVSMRWGAATSRSDPFQLPRCLPWGIRSPGFSLRLARAYTTQAD